MRKIPNACPFCNKPELHYVGFGAYAQAMFDEIGLGLVDVGGTKIPIGPLKLVANSFISIYRSYQGKMKIADSWYICKSCQTKVALCPNCDHAFIINGEVKNRTEFKCPSCSQEFYIKLG